MSSGKARKEAGRIKIVLGFTPFPLDICICITTLLNDFTLRVANIDNWFIYFLFLEEEKTKLSEKPFLRIWRKL